MGKSTRTLSGASQAKYFRDLFAATDGLTQQAASNLIAACENEIAQVGVRTGNLKRGHKPEVASATVAKPEAGTPRCCA